MNTIDLSFLNGYYASRLPQTPLAQRAAPKSPFKTQTLPEGVLPPWEQATGRNAPNDAARLRAALEVKSFADVNDASFNKAGVTQDQRKLFALYKGMTALQTLAQRAGDAKTLEGERNGLARRFAEGFAQVKSMVTSAEFDDLTLLFGDKANKATSTALIPRVRQEYLGNLVSLGGSDQALANVTGTETITIGVTKGGVETPVAADLSEISGPVTLDAVMGLMNQKLADAGMLSRFRIQSAPGQDDKAPKRYGLTLQGVATEALRFSASGAGPALYLAGTTGSGATQKGNLIKLTGLGGSEPVSAIQERVEPKDGTSDTRAAASDGRGNVYVLGGTTGDLGAGIAQGDQDVYLRKYDAAGNLVWSRMLGSSTRADGLALAVDNSGNAIIAGKTTDKLTAAATGGKADSFVAKYDGNGIEVFTRQVGSSLDDHANALAVDAAGDIYVGGTSRGRMSSAVTSSGGADAYIQKLSATGSLIHTRQFGSAGGDARISGLAIAADGNLVAASVEDGTAIVRKFAASDALAAATWSMTLGALDGGSVGGLTARNGAIYVSGAAGNAALTAGGAASVAQAHAGGSDAFVFKLTDAGASASADFVAYAGSAGAESGGALSVTDDAIYLAGTTRSGLPGQTAVADGKTNSFVRKLDLNGAAAWTYQFAGTGTSAASALAADATGASVLDALGLPSGEVATGGSRLVTAQTSVRAGDFFTVDVNGHGARKITVKSGDTLRALASRITLALGLKGKAEVARERTGDGIRITANDDTVITLKAGSGGQDALAGLGLTPGSIYGKDVKANGKAANLTLKDINSFALRMEENLRLDSDVNARRAVTNLAAAAETLKQAFTRLIEGPPPPAPPERPRGQAPDYLTNQLTGYQTALAAFGLGGGGGTIGSF